MELAIQTTKTKSRLTILDSIFQETESTQGDDLKDTVDVLSGTVQFRLISHLDL